ncbi:DUF2177 family protein [Candidatus Nomurabacteria bacterium]|nr:DUF2177 family protein [Candidatus Nomurabacteria bacterium]
MNMIFSYIAILIPLVALDALWILVLAKNFYATQIGFLFSKSIIFTPIIFFYSIYAFGVLMLVVLPAISVGSWLQALWRGALVGIVAYGAYDLTNQATISGWPTIVTLVDMCWGVIVTALTSIIAYFIITNL